MTAISNAMSDRNLTRAQLEIINKRTLRFPLQVAEKDYFLALAVQKIARSSLEKRLVFKGGTAIHHCHLPQYRFSEDLDFTSLDPKISEEEIQSALESDGLFKDRKSSHPASPSRSSACSIRDCLDNLETSRLRWTFNRTSFYQQKLSYMRMYGE